MTLVTKYLLQETFKVTAQTIYMVNPTYLVTVYVYWSYSRGTASFRHFGGTMLLEPRLMPLYEIKANLFKSLGHPARIRVLELLRESENNTAPVSHFLDYMEIEPSHLSQHLKVLRKNRVVSSRRDGAHVYYTVTDAGILELLDVARAFLTADPAPKKTAKVLATTGS